MHACVHIVSKKPLTELDIENIMQPYCEYSMPPDASSDFSWDYYNYEGETESKNAGDCYALFDTDGKLFTRQAWNDNKCEWVDTTRIFEDHVASRLEDWKDCHVYELDAHF